MQAVDEKWYRFYSWLLTIAGVSVFVVSLLALTAAQFKHLQANGFTTLTLSLACILLLYRLFAFNFVKKRYELRMACLGLNLLMMLQSINFINSTGHLHSWYHISWLIMIFFGGMFGIYMILSFVVLTSLYMVLIMTNIPGRVTFDGYSFLVLGMNFVVGVASYYFWRRFYIDQESVKVAQLSGALKTKQRQSETLLESIGDGIIVTDTQHKISLLNSAAAKMTEWSGDEAVGVDVQLVVKLLKEDGQELPLLENPFQQVLKKLEHTGAVLQLVGRQGQHRTISLLVSPVLSQKNNDIMGLVAVFRDVSAARAEERRRADFISTASHEMRTPVAAIEGYLALAMNDNVSKIDTKAREFLEKAHLSTQHLGKLFQDLLTSAKAEDGRLANHPQVVELGSYLEQLTNDLRFAATKKNLGMEFVLGTKEPTLIDASKGSMNKVVQPLYYVYVDPDRIREVISNIFDNAVKYTDSGKISLGLTGNEDIVQLYIRDTGAGIPADDIPHLFQKFYRVDSSATRTIGGSGLGLFICQKIVELYHGHLWVESEVGHGSTFYINLPRLNTQQAMEAQAKDAEVAPPPPAASLTS